MVYRVFVKRNEEGYAVWCPMLPGCWSQGDTEQEALENIKDAIHDYVLTLDEINPDTESRYVEVAS
jgi:predicted RNase H-like HicB family nuclease